MFRIIFKSTTSYDVMGIHILMYATSQIVYSKQLRLRTGNSQGFPLLSLLTTFSQGVEHPHVDETGGSAPKICTLLSCHTALILGDFYDVTRAIHMHLCWLFVACGPYLASWQNSSIWLLLPDSRESRCPHLPLSQSPLKAGAGKLLCSCKPCSLNVVLCPPLVMARSLRD